MYKDFIRENASTRENKKEAEEDWKSHHVMIKSDPKWKRGREGSTV